MSPELLAELQKRGITDSRSLDAVSASRNPASLVPPEPVMPEAPMEQPSALSQLGTATKETVKGVASGLAKGVANTVDGINNLAFNTFDAVTFGGWSNFLDYSTGRPSGQSREIMSNAAPTMAAAKSVGLDALAPQTTGGQFAETASEFLSVFIPVSGELKAAGMLGKANASVTMAAKGTGAAANIARAKIALGEIRASSVSGAVADYFAFDGNDPRFSNMISEWTSNSTVPPVEAAHAIADALAADPNDNETWGRVKNVIEGWAVGVGIESALTVRTLWKGYRAWAAGVKGADEATVKALAPTADEAKAAAEYLTTYRYSTQGNVGVFDPATQTTKSSGMAPTYTEWAKASGATEDQLFRNTSKATVFVDEGRIPAITDFAEKNKGNSIQFLEDETGARLVATDKAGKTVEELRLPADRINYVDVKADRMRKIPEVGMRPVEILENGELRVGSAIDEVTQVKTKVEAPAPPAPKDGQLRLNADEANAPTPELTLKPEDAALPPKLKLTGAEKDAALVDQAAKTEPKAASTPAKAAAQPDETATKPTGVGSSGMEEDEIVARLRVAVQNYVSKDEKAVEELSKLINTKTLAENDVLDVAQAAALSIKDLLEKGKYVKNAELRAREARKWMEDQGLGEILRALDMAGGSKGGIVSDAHVLAWQSILDVVHRQLADSLDKWVTLKDAASLAEAQAAYESWVRVALPFKKAGTKGGRVLQAFKRTAGSLTARAKYLDDLMRQAGNDPDKIAKIMNSIKIAMDNGNTASAALMEQTWGRIAVKAAAELVTNSVLGFKTVTSNIFGGLVQSTFLPAERMLGGLIRGGLTGNMSHFKASTRFWSYMMEAKGDALKAAWTAFKTLEPQISKKTFSEFDRGAIPVAGKYGSLGEAASKLTLGMQRSRGFISGEQFKINNPWVSIGIDALGELCRFSQRMIVPVDEFFKQINVHAMAKVKAMEEGLNQGLKVGSQELDNYIQTRIGGLLSNEGRLYSWESLRDQVAKEMRAEGIPAGDGFYEELLKRTRERYNNELGELSKYVEKYGDEVAFQQHLGDETVAGGIQNFFIAHPISRLLTGTLFVRTGANLLRWVGQRVLPLPFMTRFSAYRRLHRQLALDLASGDPWREAAAYGRTASGVMLMTGSAYMAMNSTGVKLTGKGPRSAQKEENYKQTGALPYSFAIPKELFDDKYKHLIDGKDKDYYYIEFKRLDPISTFLGLAADLSEKFQDPDYDEANVADYINVAAVSLAYNITEKSYFKNLKDAMDMIFSQDTAQSTESLLNRINKYARRRVAAAAVPAVVTQIVQADDQSMLDVRDIWDELDARTGLGLTYIPKKRNILGEPIDRAISKTTALNIFNPALLSETKDDPVMKEVATLDSGFGKPSAIDSSGLDLRDYRDEQGKDAYDVDQENLRTVKLDGRTLRQTLEIAIKHPSYQALTPESKEGLPSPRIAIIQNILGSYRKAARERTLEQFPKLKLDKLRVLQTKALIKQGKTIGDAQKIIQGTP